MKKRNILFFSIIICLIWVGQILKLLALKLAINQTVIPGVLNFNLVKNTGAAFGMGQKYTWVLAIFNIITIIGVLVFFIKSKDKNNLRNIGLVLTLAGGTGNLIDRIVRGYVVDYLDINELIEYPVFNMEDILIIIGVIIIGIYIIKREKNEQIHS